MKKLEKGDMVGIVGCSNGQTDQYRPKIKTLIQILEDMGLQCVCSDYLYEDGCYFSGSGKERGDALNQMYENEKIRAVFDISGGDVANEVLPYLDYAAIQEREIPLFGYSDLTTVINGIYTKTGKSSALWQVRNLLYEEGEIQKRRLQAALFEEDEELFSPEYFFVQDNFLEGTLVGGNIRCFMKLAGTKYFPEMENKILFLEGRNTSSAQAATLLCQLKQMGIFEEISGILLGTFSKLDTEIFTPSIEELVWRYTEGNIPVARTMEVGHGTDSKAIWIGKNIELSKA